MIRVNGHIFASTSGGVSGIKGSKRSSFLAMEKVVPSLVADTLKQDFLLANKFDICLNYRFVDKSIKTLLRIFTSFPVKIARNTYRTVLLRNLINFRKICHNGIRFSKMRRV
jgi:hypothetical protein